MIHRHKRVGHVHDRLARLERDMPPGAAITKLQDSFGNVLYLPRPPREPGDCIALEIHVGGVNVAEDV